MTYDLIIVGAGPVGCVVAERMATLHNWNCLIVERRDHIAGNCYDSYHASGVQIHNYGPHYFRSNNQEVVDYLSQFTDWIDGNYIVKSQVKGKQYPFPINLDTLEQFFGVEGLNPDSAKALLKEKQVVCSDPQNSEEFVLSRVGRELYEAFYLGYTKKQWDRHPSELAASVCGRIPIKFNRDPYYTEASFRKMPAAGYTALFENMLNHPRIEVRLNTDYFEVKDQLIARNATVYTGPIDRFFNYQYGRLEWRSLDFKFQVLDQSFSQECAQINYPDEHDYTRTVEIKHVTRQIHPSTVVCKEYPRSEGPPFYPVPNETNAKRYAQYKQLTTRLPEVHFIGRLAEYTYINTDEAIAKALQLSQHLI